MEKRCSMIHLKIQNRTQNKTIESKMIGVSGEVEEVEEEVTVKMTEKAIEVVNIEIKGDLMIKKEDRIIKNITIKKNQPRI